MKKAERLFCLIVAATLLWGAATGCTGPRVLKESVAQAAANRLTAPELPEGDLATLATGNTAFAVDLYRALRGQPANLFYSPFSISQALAMAYAGARGQTESQIAQALRYTLPQDRLHAAFNYLDLQLASRGASAKGQDDKGFRLKVANSVWGQTGYQFLAEYLDVLAKNYGAGLRLLDFQRAPEPARQTINLWVKDHTEGKIPDLIPPGAIDAQTRLVLANAVYFNAAWKYSFDVQSTRPGPFTLPDGRQVSLPMMHRTASFSYAKGSGWQAVELPYDGDELSMVVVVPDAGAFQTFEDALSAEALKGLLGQLRPTSVILSLPKFKFGSTFRLGSTLSGLGMRDATSAGKADFSGMAGNRDFYISDVIHKAIVEVNEKGTEAAAATAVILAGSAARPSNDVTLTVDRPFIFLIRDVKTGTVVFVGRVLNPEG